MKKKTFRWLLPIIKLKYSLFGNNSSKNLNRIETRGKNKASTKRYLQIDFNGTCQGLKNKTKLNQSHIQNSLTPIPPNTYPPQKNKIRNKKKKRRKIIETTPFRNKSKRFKPAQIFSQKSSILDENIYL